MGQEEIKFGTRRFKIIDKHQMANLFFQNVFWFIINTLTLLSITMWVNMMPEREKLYRELAINYFNWICPCLLICGCISLTLIYTKTRKIGMIWKMEDIYEDVEGEDEKKHSKKVLEKYVIDPLMT